MKSIFLHLAAEEDFIPNRAEDPIRLKRADFRSH